MFTVEAIWWVAMEPPIMNGRKEYRPFPAVTLACSGGLQAWIKKRNNKN